jgi:hypothetical protein
LSHPNSQLSLDQEGWVRVDKASTRVRGDATKIIEEMQRIVNEGVVISLCKEMGIYSTAFLFHDYFKKFTRFYSDDAPAQTYGTRYLWGEGVENQRLSDLVHWLFVQVRETQYTNYSAADYYVNLPIDDADDDALPFERSWRAEYDVHYCSVGEMLFTSFTWRALRCAVALGIGESSINTLRFGFEQSLNVNVKCDWAGASLSDDDNAPELLKEIWGNEFGPQETWGGEWEKLLLLEKSNREAAMLFLSNAGFADTMASDDSPQVNMHFFDAIPSFLKWLKPEQGVGTVAEALATIETFARFPVLPFYTWNALNKTVLCYAVVPIWTSQNHSVVLPTGKCPHFGLALTAVRPVAAWDSTVSTKSNCDPRVLVNFLRLMARPLVESNLYHWQFKHIADDLASPTQAVINHFSKDNSTDSNQGNI